MSGIVSPIQGASIKQVWKPQLDGVNAAGSFYDNKAPFALGTRVLTSEPARGVAQFARAAGAIGIGATTGITAGATVGAAAGNTWTNDTGVALVAGDYAFFTVAEALSP